MRRLFLPMLAFLVVLLLIVTVPIMLGPKQEVWFDNQVAVIAYHHIDDHVQSDVTITRALFEAQLKDLLSRGYRFITLQQFRDFRAGQPVPPNAVLVTFDDGYESFYTNAYPILRKLGIPAVNFVITKDLDNPQASLVPSLSRDEIRRMMEDSELTDVQCHTDSLHDKQSNGAALFTSRLNLGGHTETDEEYKQRILQDTGRCVQKLKELNRKPVDSFAFPFGVFDAPSAQLLTQAGIRYAFTTVSEMATRQDDPLQIPRINAGSPFVRANSLHNLIVKRIVSPLPPGRPVDVLEAVRDIGGKTVTDKSGVLSLEYNGVQWSLPLGASAASSSQGQAVTLQAPLAQSGGSYTLREDDLEKLLAIQLTYNANTGHFIRRVTPTDK